LLRRATNNPYRNCSRASRSAPTAAEAEYAFNPRQYPTSLCFYRSTKQ
jgi:hypothetical protein